MIILSWNLMGSNFPKKLKVVRIMIRKHKLDFLILQETKIKGGRQDNLKRRIQRKSNFDFINSLCRSRGLALFWNLNTIVAHRIPFDSNICLYVRISSKIDAFSSFLLNIYAPNKIANRKMFWKLLKAHRASFITELWIIVGDFNTSLEMEDKMGGRLNLKRSMVDLRYFLNETKMIDLTCKGSKFTCSNRQYGNNFIQRILEKMVVSTNWRENYQNIELICLPRISSNHRPINLFKEGK